VDCPLWFAAERAAEGCCNAGPLRVGRPQVPSADPKVARRREQWRVAQRARRAAARGA